jgi:hypothetical protein
MTTFQHAPRRASLVGDRVRAQVNFHVNSHVNSHV